MEKDLNVTKESLTLTQRVAICFAAGVIGGLAVVFFSEVNGVGPREVFCI